MDESQLRHEAADRIQRGVLPKEDPVRTWAGPGTGKPCALCERPIVRTETEFELEFSEKPDFRLHALCHAVWQLEREQRR